MDNVQNKRKLEQAREGLGLSLRAAGELVGISFQQVWNYEQGAGQTGPAKDNIRNLCRAYMKIAPKFDYTPDHYHESMLCPGEFPEPASKPTVEVA